MELAPYCFAAVAALLVGFSKTGVPGAALPAVALMAESFRQETKLSVGALLPVLLVGDLFAIFYYRRHAQWNQLGRLMPWVVAGAVPGYLVLKYVANEPLRALLGWLIIGLLVLQFLPRLWGSPRPGLGGRALTAASGLLAGFGTTVGNAAGPAMSIYLVSSGLDKHEFLGTSAWFFFIVNLCKVPLFASLNMITSQTLARDLAIIPLTVAGALSGAAVLRRIPQRLFDTLVLLLAAAAALRLLLS